jgi:hypothetical protein
MTEFVKGDIIAINQNTLQDTIAYYLRGTLLATVSSTSPAKYWIYVDGNGEPLHHTQIAHTYPANKINKVLYPDYVEYEGRLIPKRFL